MHCRVSNTLLTQVTHVVSGCHPFGGDPAGNYFLSLRRWTRVLRSSLRCFFFDMRLRRFLMTEPTSVLWFLFSAWLPGACTERRHAPGRRARTRIQSTCPGSAAFAPPVYPASK